VDRFGSAEPDFTVDVEEDVDLPTLNFEVDTLGN